MKHVAFHTTDGRPLHGTWWEGDDAAERSVLILGAMATPHRFYRHMAAYLADQGWGVLGFDYGGVAASQSGGDRRTDADDWARGDLPAALAALRILAAPRKVGVVGHSLGGQLFGMSPIRHHVQGAVFVSCQRGMARLFDGWDRVRLELAWRLAPAWVRLFGSAPPGALPEKVPAAALLQWMRWCRTGVFSDASGASVEDRFAEYRGPLVSIRVADDHAHAPARAVAALEACYSGAALSRVTWTPEEFQVGPLGHFGPFHAGREVVWDDLDGRLCTVLETST